MNFIYKLKRFFRNFAVENLMTYIAASMAIIFIGDLLTDGLMTTYLTFNRAAILHGQVWRIITFLMLPQTNSVIWIAISVYFYYITGKETEMAWGARNLTLYFFTGSALLIAVGFLVGSASSSYLLFSLFLVYARIYPNMEIRLFAILPIQAKWIALIDVVFMVCAFGNGFKYYAMGLPRVGLGIQLSVVAAFATYFIFFGREYIDRLKNRRRHREFLNGGKNGNGK